MKKNKMLFLLLLQFGFVGLSEAKPFNRVLVLSGGALRTAIFLGAIEGAIESGWKPDLLLTTCGASFGAAIANFSSDPKEWRAFVESKEFYEFMQTIGINPALSDPNTAISTFLALKVKQAFTIGKPKIFPPDIFSLYAVELPFESRLALDKAPFSSEGIRSAMVAARLDFDKKDLGVEAKKKIFTQVFFTDKETAPHFKGMKALAHQNYPYSYVALDTDTYVEVPLYAAARASMSEPRLTQVFSYGTTAFIAGSVDSYPIEIATSLGEQVVAGAAGEQGLIEPVVYKDTFGIDLDKRVRESQKQPVEHWIDFTDIGDVDEKMGFGPRVRFQDKIEFHQDFPESHEAFVKKIQMQWEYGREQSRHAFKTPKNSRAHLRKDILKGKK